MHLAARGIATAFVFAAIWHVIAIANPPFAYPVNYPVGRHAVFVAINLVFAWLFLIRPRWLIWPYAVLTLQIFSGHGVAIVTVWRNEARIDWTSVAVIAVTLAGLAVAARVSRKPSLN